VITETALPVLCLIALASKASKWHTLELANRTETLNLTQYTQQDANNQL
jgi:hypothetical protein